MALESTYFVDVRRRLEAFTPRPGWRSYVYEFLLFGFKQGWACLFGGIMLALLIGTRFLYPEHAWLARYDFLTIAAVTVQIGMLLLRLETLQEAKVIFAFHVVGTVMEVFKTAFGSWAYPEYALLKIGGVPLFSGFMYAAIGSYIARIWRIFDFRYRNYPKPVWGFVIAVLIYVNFFAHHWLPDIRLFLFLGMGVLFRRTWVVYRIWRAPRQMPLLLGWFLVALFIWFAENIGTFANGWVYPNQVHGWALVSPMKLGAWYLLMYISFTLVAAVHSISPAKDVDS